VKSPEIAKKLLKAVQFLRVHIQLLVYSRVVYKITRKVRWKIMHALEARTFSIQRAKNYEYRFQFLQVIED